MAKKYEVFVRVDQEHNRLYPIVAVSWPHGLVEFVPTVQFIKDAARRGAPVK